MKCFIKFFLLANILSITACSNGGYSGAGSTPTGSGGQIDPGAPTTKPTVLLILTMGNSHTVGRDIANPDDAFPANVYEWTQANELRHPIDAQLDFGDTASGYQPWKYTADVSLAHEIAANEDYDYIVFVPRGQGSTGFSSGHWSVPTHDTNLLSDATKRFIKARRYLEAEGFTIKDEVAFFHNANPDFNTGDWALHRTNIDSMVDYLRTYISPVLPVVIGGGMNATEFAGRPTNDALFRANLIGTNRRLPFVGTYDTINPRYGFSEGLPVPVFADVGGSDAIHAIRSGDVTKGKLRYRAWKRAQLNTNPTAPFSGLASWERILAAWDFRSGTNLDLANGHHLLIPGGEPPLIRLASDIDELVYNRPAGVDRVYSSPIGIPENYTVSTIIKADAINQAMGIVSFTDPINANGQFRFNLSAANGGSIVAGHSAISISVTNSYFEAGEWAVLTLTYNSSTQTLDLFVNGNLIGSANSIAPVDEVNSTGFFIGSQNSTYTNPFRGSMVGVWLYDKTFTRQEVTQWYNSARTIID